MLVRRDEAAVGVTDNINKRRSDLDLWRLFIVEDDLLIGMLLEQFCSEAGLEVVGTAVRANEAIPRILSLRPTHIILDYRLAGKRTGLDILQEVRAHLTDIRVVFLTASNERPTLTLLTAAKPDAILIKPVAKQHFLETLFSLQPASVGQMPCNGSAR